MSDKYNILFTPFNIGKQQIKNRFIMGPMGCNQMYDSYGALNNDGIAYYTERAKGGFGAVFLGVAMVDNLVDNYPPTLVENPLYAPDRYKKMASMLVERCGAYGTKVFGEVGMGGGRNSRGALAPSAVETFNFPNERNREITVDQIHKKQECMIKAAALMKDSGFAGVDLHAAHWGYLLDNFLMPIANHREDEYGGCLENRVRVITEMVEGIHQVCGSDFAVTIGLGVKSFITALNKGSLTGENEAGRTVEEAIEIAKLLEKAGVNAILADVGIYDSFYHACPPGYMPKGHALDLYAQVKEQVGIPVLARSRMGDPDLCLHAVESGKVDGVVLARPALADPYFPRKIEMGIPEKIRPCIGCNVGCYGNMVERGIAGGCAVNPRATRELNTRPRKAVNPRKIAVIGGGPAGMQAAIIAAECGHTVELFEKNCALGGEVLAAGADSMKVDVRRYKDWLIGELRDNKVPVHLNTLITADEVQIRGFDTVILATGAESVAPASIKGINKAVSALDVLEGKVSTGKKVLVAGGGQIGCETAVALARDGYEVSLLEAMPSVMDVMFVPKQPKMMLKAMLEQYKVNMLTGMKLLEVNEKGALIQKTDGSTEPEQLECDTTVLAIGLRPVNALAESFRGRNITIYQIGSARRVGDIFGAVHDAFEVVYNMD